MQMHCVASSFKEFDAQHIYCPDNALLPHMGGGAHQISCPNTGIASPHKGGISLLTMFNCIISCHTFLSDELIEDDVITNYHSHRDRYGLMTSLSSF